MTRDALDAALAQFHRELAELNRAIAHLEQLERLQGGACEVVAIAIEERASAHS